MKIKKILGLFISTAVCLSSFTAFATDGENNDKLCVFHNDEIINFDVEPIIENDRTLVPMRAIFEAMGCAVYYSVEDGKQIISARRANDNLMLTIGENKMYFNGGETELDVPAKIKDGRTLVPLRAISEAFECEVLWHGDTRTIDIYSPANAYAVSAEKLSETITDDEGNVLIEAVAYYPVIENPTGIPCLDKINSDYKLDAEKFMEEAGTEKEDALIMKNEMGEAFTPFVYELTFEQTYRVWGYLSFTNHKYINIGGAHPSKIMESGTYSTSLEEEMSVSSVISEDILGTPIAEYTANLFVDKLNELAPEETEEYTYDYVSKYLEYVQFYITKNSMVLYFNQGDIAPYALGVISVEIPYSQEIFHTDMSYEDDDISPADEQNADVISPLPETLDINALDNCTVPVSLEKGGVYVDDSGKAVMDVVVYSYELYDIADIATLEENDIIIRQNEEIKVTSLERLESGLIRINGGEENGGFDLASADSTVYFEVGMDDVKAYYELGKITLLLSDEFEFADKTEKTYYPGDFLIEDSGIEYNFSPADTSIVIENGIVVQMSRIPMP